MCKDRYQKQNKLITDKQFSNAVLCAGILSGGHDSCQGKTENEVFLNIVIYFEQFMQPKSQEISKFFNK